MDSFMISTSSKASAMILCTIIVLLNIYQNTKKNFKNIAYDVITKNNLKIWASAKPDKLKR